MEMLTDHMIYDYADILKTYGLSYAPVEYYWQVGEIKQTQGWILHLSVVSMQVQRLLELLIPELISKNLSFRIVRDAFIAGNLAEGGFGYAVLGKMVSIYPENESQANAIAKYLISLTAGLRGPHIPTDRHLGSIVYTRYGSFSPVLLKSSNGEWVKHIYDAQGQLVVDSYDIPFRVPEGQSWPFGDITAPEAPNVGRLLNYKYYPLQVIKPDAKGDVIKGLYFKKAWQIRSCLIKEGRANMFTDEHGRDIQHRLKWQYHLYKALHEDIPMPEVFDHFEANGNTYLAMQFIKGQTLSIWYANIYQDRSWHDLSLPQRLELVDQLLRIISIISCMHKKGYVHRDITPENFLLDKRGNLFLIDMELTWCVLDKPAQPPFKQGTPGHMSPEQQRGDMPSNKEDIYALGSMIVTFLANLYALKITGQSKEQIQETLNFLNGEPMIGQLVAACWDDDPDKRPTLEQVISTLREYREKLKKQGSNKIPLLATPNPDNTTLKRIIQAGLDHLGSPGLLSPKNRWISLSQRRELHIGNQQDAVEMYEGWHTGMAGPLWLVALAKRMGYSVEACKSAYAASWEYIDNNFFAHPDQMSPGLYGGSAGIALAINEGLSSGLLQPDEAQIKRLQSCFSLLAGAPELSDGIAGQGIALLQCSSCLDNGWVQERLTAYLNTLISMQQSDGSWNIHTGINAGTSGTLLFLLSYLKHRQDDKVASSAIRAIQWLKKNRIFKDKNFYWPLSIKDKRMGKWSASNGSPGVCLAFIKAYDVLGDTSYREMAEESLLQLPERSVLIDYSFASGLAGLGEIYLEAARIFQDPIWQQRADWIVKLIMTCFKGGAKGSGHWLTIQNEISTADLFIGNGGILLFLLKYTHYEKINHPLL